MRLATARTEKEVVLWSPYAFGIFAPHSFYYGMREKVYYVFKWRSSLTVTPPWPCYCVSQR